MAVAGAMAVLTWSAGELREATKDQSCRMSPPTVPPLPASPMPASGEWAAAEGGAMAKATSTRRVLGSWSPERECWPRRRCAAAAAPAGVPPEPAAAASGW